MLYEPEYYFSRTIKDRDLDYREISYIYGLYSHGTPSDTHSVHSGAEYGGLGEAVFETMYTKNELYSLGFIVADTTRNITIWNAYTKTPKILNTVTLFEDDNFTLEPYNTPMTFQSRASITKSFTVTRTGMLPQNTTIQYNFLTENLRALITGLRAEAIYYHTNTKDIDFEIKFKTAEFKNERNVSYRRSLIDSPEYTITCTYIESKENAASFYHKMISVKARPLLVPIYTCAETIAVNPKGSNTITTVNNTSTNFFLRNSNFIVIPDAEESRQLSGVTGNSIVCDTIFSDDIEVGTKVFPAFLGILDKISMVAKTNQTVIFTVTYKTIAIESKIEYTVLGAFNFELIDFKSIKMEFNLNRFALKQNISPYEIFEYSDKVQRTFSGECLLSSNTAIYDFLSYVYAAKGKLNTFNIRNPFDVFTLKENATTGNSYFICYKFEEAEYNTLLIEANGIQETYTIVSITQNTNDTQINITPNITRDIATSEVGIFTTLDTVIFDQDSFKLKYKSQNILSCGLKFRTINNEL